MNKYLHHWCSLVLLLTLYAVQVSSLTSLLGSGSTTATTTRFQNLTRDPNHVKFYIVKDWEDQKEIILNDRTSLDNSPFQRGQKTFILIDGYDSPRTPFYKLVTDAIRANSVTSNDNLIIVNYRKLSGRDSSLSVQPFVSMLLYFSVLKNVDILGERVAHFIHFLQLQGDLPPSQVHVVGMSMGCHISGAAGIYLKKLSQQKLGRITGLDPARTLYPLRIVKRLRSSEGVAEFIDAYHTNRGILGEVYEGTADINVYVNGGAIQPGCERQDFTLIPYPGLCSHLFAWEVFAATFSQDIFACPCTGWGCYCQTNCPTCSNSDKALKIGMNVPKSARGSYHTTVTDPAPGEYYTNFSSVFPTNG